MHETTILLVLFFSILYAHTFVWLANIWFTDPVYSHGILIPVVSLFLAWKSVRDNDIHNTNPSGLGILPFIFGILLYLIGSITIFPFLSAISLLFVLSGLILYLYGEEMMKLLLFPVLFLVFAIPIPIVPAISATLQSISARYSALCLEMLGIAVTRIGSEIQLRDCSFWSGLQRDKYSHRFTGGIFPLHLPLKMPASKKIRPFLHNHSNRSRCEYSQSYFHNSDRRPLRRGCCNEVIP
ncbi:MAG: hypothetical protein GWP10_18340 [Nitrospiraceae bacterium]|nr:hypothetical protein [Nitrospiraceae bacterium]